MKFFAKLPDGSRDRTSWMKRKLDAIYAHGSYNYVVKHICLGDVDFFDTLFDNEPTRKQMTGFRIFTGNALDEASVMALVSLGAIITGGVYSFNITEDDAFNTDGETEVTHTAPEPKVRKI